MLHHCGESSRHQEDSDSDSDDATAYPAYPAFYLHPEPMQVEQSTSRGENARSKELSLEEALKEAERILRNEANIRKRSSLEESRRMLMKEMTHVDRKATCNNIPHSWLGDGTLLRLMDPAHSGNYVIFQRVWKRELPLIISDLSKKLDMKLWNPSYFRRNFGDEKNDIIDCVTGDAVDEQPMQLFWDGFENVSRRPRDEEGTPMLLKLKEWPHCTSFRALLPFHMHNLLDSLPLSAYTHPHGLLNFVNYLPDGFLTQDLGTELLCAYGTTDHPSVGTKNLDVSVADVVNVLVYVGNSRNGDSDNHSEQNQVLQALRDAGCDNRSIERVKKNGDTPGAIWHVYNVREIRKINDLLNKVLFERGVLPRPHQEPVQGEVWYLDNVLRERLKREYNVVGRAVLQCVGDAVFIPAGAPHQVRNIKSCIIVKHDFISLQNLKKF